VSPVPAVSPVSVHKAFASWLFSARDKATDMAGPLVLYENGFSLIWTTDIEFV